MPRVKAPTSYVRGEWGENGGCGDGLGEGEERLLLEEGDCKASKGVNITSSGRNGAKQQFGR